MRTFIQHRVAVCPVFASALLFACLAAVTVLSAQTPVQTSAPAAHPVAHHRKPKPAASQGKAVPPPAVVEPPKPNWPVNNQPAPAAVSWDQHSLRINASNSSLDQILTQITSATGAKIEGVGGDQRIFGVFGPGRARDVLSDLLQGSGYNVVMVGDNGHGLPREVLLSDRNAAGSAPAAMRPQPQQQDDDFEDAPDTSQVDSTPQPPVQPLEPLPRTPQQMQEQQMMQQQQEQPGQPPPQQQPQ